MYDLTTMHKKNLQAVAKMRKRDKRGRWIAATTETAKRQVKKKRAADRTYRRKERGK